MSGKLLKYEFQATGRIMPVFYIALLIMSVIMKAGLSIVPEGMWHTPLFMIPAAVMVMLYIILFAAAFIVTLLLIIQRFYKNLVCDEGYLMHTLPVKTWQLIAGKLIAAVVWTLISFIAGGLSMMIISAGTAFDVGELLRQIKTGFYFNLPAVTSVNYTILLILVFVAYIASSCLRIYAAIAVGQTANKHKIAGSFAAYIVFSCVLQFISSTVIYIFGLLADRTGIFNVVLTGGESGVYLILISIIILQLIECAALFAVTEYFMRKKLNLE